MVMILVFRAVYERYGTLTHMPRKLFHCHGIIVQLCEIAILELGSFCRLVAKPFAERGAGCNVLEPEINPRSVLGHSARPEPIDKNPKPVARFWFFVCAFKSSTHWHTGYWPYV